MLCGFFGGRWTGAGAAVGAAVSFDFFHTQPYLELRIKSSDDIVTTLLLLAIGLVVGQVAVVAHRRKRVAIQRHSEVERVWRVAELAARGGDTDDVISAVRAELLSLLHLSDCSFSPETHPSLPMMAVARATCPNAELRYQDGGFELPRHGFAIPVHLGAQIVRASRRACRCPTSASLTTNVTSLSCSPTNSRWRSRLVRTPTHLLDPDEEESWETCLFIAITIAFFALAAGFVKLCDHIIGPDPDHDPESPDESTRPARRRRAMTADNIIGLVIALLVAVYLVAALISPERF